MENGVLMDWTFLDDTGGEPTLESSEQEFSGTSEKLLHIDMCHNDANDASTNYAQAIILVKSGSTDEDWHELVRYSATGGQATGQVLAANSGSGQGNPERIELADTSNHDIPGKAYFLKDVGTLADSCIVFNKNTATNDYIEHIDNLVNAYDNSDYLYDIVDMWTFRIPPSVQKVKVLFKNNDADATYACRVHYSQD